MPVEFQGAAYRFGHSIVRPSYRANLAGDNGQPFFGLIFRADDPQPDDPVDLRGGVRASRRFIGWQTFFDFGDGEVRRNKLIDTRLSSPLFELPLGTIATGEPPTSLATRNLLRHITWSQPSGQEIAAAVGAPRLSAADLAELQGYGVGLERSTPLWYSPSRRRNWSPAVRRSAPSGRASWPSASSGCSSSTATRTAASPLAPRPADPGRHGHGRLRHGRPAHLCRRRPDDPTTVTRG